MKRLYFTVEGQTEQEFVKSVLTPHLASYNVMVQPARLTGLHRRRRGRIPSGGLLSTFQHSLQDMRIWLKEDKSPEARFTMMVDLYGLPNDFPEFSLGIAAATPLEQAGRLEDALSRVLNDPRFIPYLQVHEFEALVLVEPVRLAGLYDLRQADLVSLANECKQFASPEHINHGDHTHPKRQILRRVPNYDPRIAGPLLAQEIGLAAIRDHCAHFNSWLSQLEQLDRN